MTTKPAPVLKPCPFCGGAAQAIPGSGKLKPTLEETLAQPPSIRCSNGQCGARYVPGGFPIEEWQARPVEQPPAPPLTADFVFNAIKHGDAEHQAWLRAKCDELFAASPQPPADAPHLQRVRHKRRRTVYEIVGKALMQCETPIDDNATMVVYRNPASGELWVRPQTEFHDGRFEPVDAAMGAPTPRTDLDGSSSSDDRTLSALSVPAKDGGS